MGQESASASEDVIGNLKIRRKIYPILVDDVIADVCSSHDYGRAEGVSEELLSLGVRHVECEADRPRPV